MAEHLGLVDDFALVRGIVALVKHSRAAWLPGSVAAAAWRSGGMSAVP